MPIRRSRARRRCAAGDARRRAHRLARPERRWSPRADAGAVSAFADAASRHAVRLPNARAAGRYGQRVTRPGGAIAGRRRDGQAGRGGTQLLLRHRPVFCIRRTGDSDGRMEWIASGVLHAHRPDADPSADAATVDGYVFRVDMRLRPFGESGPLCSSFAALEDYLQIHGRDWERYAWVKARARHRPAPPMRHSFANRASRSFTGAIWTSACSSRCAR